MSRLKRLFSGRIDRLRFLLRSLFAFCVTLGVYWTIIIFRRIFMPPHQAYGEAYDLGDVLWGALFLSIFLIYLILQLSISVRRLHDIGESGWMSLILFAPFINVLYAIYLLLAKGEEGPNKFGNPPPKEIPLLKGIIAFK